MTPAVRDVTLRLLHLARSVDVHRGSKVAARTGAERAADGGAGREMVTALNPDF